MERELMDEIVTSRINNNLSETRRLLAGLTRCEIHELLTYMANDLNYDINDVLLVTKFL